MNDLPYYNNLIKRRDSSEPTAAVNNESNGPFKDMTLDEYISFKSKYPDRVKSAVVLKNENFDFRNFTNIQPRKIRVFFTGNNTQ